VCLDCDGRRQKQIPSGNDSKKSKGTMEARGATGCGKELNKRVISSAVVPVAEGKVEIWRKVVWSMGLQWG
jgi:hypothetical protein